MSILKNYEDFIREGNSSKFGAEEGMNESRSMAKYNSDQFREMFSQRVMESEGQSDNIVEKLHSYYEIGMLLESKSKWFEDGRKAHYIDADQAVIIVKDSEAFVIEKKTFDMMRGSTEWIAEVESSNLIKEGFSLIKEGFLTKAKDFLVKCGSVLKELFAPKSTSETIMLIMSILSAAAGIAGAFVPGFTIVSGILLALNGILHIRHGMHELKHAKELISDIGDLTSVEKSTASYIKAAPAFLAGGLGISMGAYDIGKGVTTALVNPTSALASSGIKTAAHFAMTKIGGPGGFVHHLIEHLLEHIASSEVVLKAVTGLSMGILPIVLHAVLKKVCPFVWDVILAGATILEKGMAFTVSLPGKIGEMIDKYQEFAKDKGWFNLHTILSKGLGLIAKPILDFLKNIVEKWISPALDATSTFVKNQMIASSMIQKHGLDKIIEDSEKEKSMGVDPIGEDSLKNVLPDAPDEKVSGQAKESPENKQDVEEAKDVVDKLAKAAGKPSDGGEEDSAEKLKKMAGKPGLEFLKKQESAASKKNWKYLVEYNRFDA